MVQLCDESIGHGSRTKSSCCCVVVVVGDAVAGLSSKDKEIASAVGNVKLNYTVSQKKSQNCFCHNFVKCSPNLIMFGMEVAKTMKLCKIHSLSTSPNFCQRTTV